MAKKNDTEKSEKKYRHFFIRSYLSTYQLTDLLNKKSKQIRHYAFIYHDKDMKEDNTPVEPHYHIILTLYHARLIEDMEKWFTIKDEEERFINNNVQICKDRKLAYEYLTHKGEEGKTVYKDEDIVSDDPDYFFNNVEDEDNLYLAVNDLLDGVSIRTCCARYGRDFIIHFGHIRTLVNSITMQEKGVDFFETN